MSPLTLPIWLPSLAAATTGGGAEGGVASNGFYTVESFCTVSGAAAITWFVCNGLQRAFNFNPRWLALVVAEVVSFTGLAFTGTFEVKTCVLACVNGFVIYAAAIGGNKFTAPANGQTTPSPGGGAPGGGLSVQSLDVGAPAPAPAPRRRFNEAWF
jgi:hypothetical protein